MPDAKKIMKPVQFCRGALTGKGGTLSFRLVGFDVFPIHQAMVEWEAACPQWGPTGIKMSVCPIV